MSLGGVRDEAEIRGHRRTYIGACPAASSRDCGGPETRDPVFMLDEIDKIGADWRGDPLVRAAGGAGPGAKQYVRRHLSGRAARSLTSAVHRDG
jgi:hypothetical protein